MGLGKLAEMRMQNAWQTLALAAMCWPMPAMTQSTQTLTSDRSVLWTVEQTAGATLWYQAGPFDLAMSASPDPADPGFFTPILTVSIAGAAPVEVEGELGAPSYDQRVGLGRFDEARPYIYFQSYSGGAHCCTSVKVVLPEAGQLQVFDLGAWDGNVVETVPSDVDDDGKVDFVFADNRFLYAFASYADSFAPPQILNIEHGEVVDVSTRLGFRPLFEDFHGVARRACLDPGESAPNGACAGYVAAAARLGVFDHAWSEMLQAYDRSSDWGLENQCRLSAQSEVCPPTQSERHTSFPEALRAFLIDAGYILPPR